MPPPRITLLGLAGALLLAAPAASGEDNPLLGTWLTEDRESKVEIYPCGTALCGKIVEILDPEKPGAKALLDTRNEDPALRGRPILGLRILEGFMRESERRWVDGQGYNPRSGRVYDGVEIELKDDGRLAVGGCIIWGLLCDSETWSRAGD